MSNLTVKGNAAGTGTVIFEAPNTNSNRTITLPDATTTVVGTDAAQTLTNKTLTSPAITNGTITGSILSGTPIQGGALTLSTSQATTSGTSIDFTGIPSWVKRITVMFNGVSTNGTSPRLVQLGTSSGPITSGYASESFTQGGSSVSVTNGFVLQSLLAANLLHGSMQISSFGGGVWTEAHGCATGVNGIAGGGGLTGAGTIDRVRITTVNGTDTFDAGSVNIMYEG